MSLTKVKTKGQVTIPSVVLRQLRLRAGDLLKVKLERSGIITLTPQTIIDRRIEESLEQYRKGKDYGPFADADAAINFLQKEVKKRSKNSKRS